jgi:hypothetical protein
MLGDANPLLNGKVISLRAGSKAYRCGNQSNKGPHGRYLCWYQLCRLFIGSRHWNKSRSSLLNSGSVSSGVRKNDAEGIAFEAGALGAPQADTRKPLIEVPAVMNTVFLFDLR